MSLLLAFLRAADHPYLRARSMSEPDPWYSAGLKFTCTQCGDCCTGAPGYVWVNKEEIAGLARRLKMEVADFEAQYVRLVGIRKSLVERKNGDCIFFDTKARNCGVYEDRPRQCRTWPFWDSNVNTPESWQRTCEACPGSGKGKVHSLEEIRERLVQIKL